MKKYTPAGIENYLLYLGSYRARLDDVGIYTYTPTYDFEYEHKLVERCEAGELLSVEEQPIRDNE